MDNLRSLDLRRNFFGMPGFVLLTDALVDSPTLRTLNVDDCDLSERVPWLEQLLNTK